MLVSIVTPSLNQAPYLEASLRSVADQDYPYVEHIIVDGGSTDGSVEIVRSWAESHPVRWSSGPDSGQADAIRRGVAMARGSIVAWLNSDDTYLDGRVLSDVVALFEKGAEMVTGGGWYLSETGERLRHIPVRPDRIDRETLRCVDWILQPATFVRRDLIVAFPLDIGLTYAFDWDFFIRVSKSASFTPIHRDIAGYRIHGDSKTVSGGGRRQKELAEVIGRYHSRRSGRYALIRTVAWLHCATDRLPRPLRRASAWFLLRFAHATQELTRGKGIPS